VDSVKPLTPGEFLQRGAEKLIEWHEEQARRDDATAHSPGLLQRNAKAADACFQRALWHRIQAETVRAILADRVTARAERDAATLRGVEAGLSAAAESATGHGGGSAAADVVLGVVGLRISNRIRALSAEAIAKEVKP